MKKFTMVLFCLLAALLALAPASAQQPQNWWNQKVFYELFVRSFYDSNGDGVGDLQGVIQKLDYLNDGDPTTTTDLGVTGLYLMPIMASPSYHGYDVTDYKTVNPEYGTNDDFKQLVTEAHKRGISVIVDLVINHTSNQNPWFQASAAGDPQYADWYRWMDTCPAYRGPFGEQVWFPLNGRCYYAIFSSSQPDLNYENPAVTSTMDDIARYWLQDMGADGFRLDALQHIIEDGQKQADTPQTRAWATAFHQYNQSVNPNSLTVGEVDNNSFVTAAYVPQAADLVFEFDLAQAMLQSAGQGTNAAVTSLQNRVNSLYPPGQYAAFLTNHDQNRVMNDLLNKSGRAEVAADLLLTQPGVPFIYYGEEIGMSGAKPDERIRTPMQWDSSATTAGFTTGQPWEALQNNAATVNVADESADPTSLLSHYRDLIHLRSDHPVLQSGDFVPVDTDSHGVYSFLRRSADETLLVVINLSAQPVSDYHLSTSSGLTAGQQATVVTGAATVVQPQIGADGSFSGYQPVSELAPQSLLVVQFAP